MEKYTLTEEQVSSLVEQAVQYGVSKLDQKSALAITFGSIWLDGYIYANKRLTEDDAKSLRATIQNYYFF